MKEILAFDFGGTLAKTDAADEGHKEWFNVMSFLLKDEKVKSLAGKKEYFKDVISLMERYTGLSKEKEFDKILMTKLARSLYQLTYMGEFNKIKSNSQNNELIKILKELKKDYSLAVISTVPEDILNPLLEILEAKDLFDYVYGSPTSKEPSKYQLLKNFVQNVKKPFLYIGNSEEDIRACKELKIKSVLAKWFRYDKEAEGLADLEASSPTELKKIIAEEKT